MADDQDTKQEAAQAPDVSGTEPQEPPKSSAPPVDPTAVARQAVAEQRLAEVQSRLDQLTNANQAIVQQLNLRQQQDFERELAELPAAERAERRAQMTQQQLQYLQQQIARQQQTSSDEVQKEYFRTKSREIEEKVNREAGLSAEARVAIRDVPQHILQSGPEATETYLRTEAENRKRKAAPTRSPDEQIESAVRKALVDAGVAGPVGARPAAPQGEVQPEDWKKLAWAGVAAGNKIAATPGHTLGTHGTSMAKQRAALEELRDRAYREAGIGA